VFKNIVFLFHAECIEKRTAVIAVKGMQEKKLNSVAVTAAQQICSVQE
jgi:hypothetical protein